MARICEGTQPRKSVRFYLAFLSICVCAFTVALETTIFPVALPTIKNDMSASTVQYFWASSVYLLLCVLSQPLATSLSNIFGRVHLLYGCISIFGIGAALVGAAPNIDVLILGRAIQGIGGGGLDVLVEIIVTDMTSLMERAFYIGLLNVPTALGSMLGPIIGGAFTTYVTWRWVAWINLPTLGVAMALSLLFLRLKPIEMSARLKWARIDWIGMALFVIGFAAFIAPLSWGGILYSWKSWKTYVPFIVGSLILAVFAVYEYHNADPMLPRLIFSTATSACCMLGSLIHGIMTYAIIYILPLYYQGVQGESAVQSSVSCFVFSFLAIPSGTFAAFLVPMFRRYNWIMWTGWITLSVGVGILSILDVETSRSKQLGLQTMAGIGIGILFTIIAIPLQAKMKPDDVGLAVGTLVFFRLTGQVIGLAVSAAIFSNMYAARVARLKNLPSAAQPFKDGNTAVYAITRLPTLDEFPAAKRKILETYAVSLRWVWIALAVLGPIGLVTSFFIKCETLEKDETGQQSFIEATHRNGQSS